MGEADLQNNEPFDPATRFIQRISRNAYRILGLPGNTSQKEIRDSARSLRLAYKAGIDRTTPWDLPWIEAVDRGEMDIQDAEGRLANPSQRLKERFFWFQEGASESTFKALSLDSLQDTIDAWSSIASITVEHDVALLNLIALVLFDQEVWNEDQWLATLLEWRWVVDSDNYWSAVADIESYGDFEPSATNEEIHELRGKSLRLIADVLAGIARDAVARNDLAVCHRVLKVLRKAEDTHLAKKLVVDFQEEILGPLEDSFDALCTDIRRECSDGIERTDEAAEKNRLVCQMATEQFNNKVEVRFKGLMRLAGANSDVGLRLRETAAECLRDIAIDWTWADDFVQAEVLLKQAVEIAANTTVVLQIEEDLKRISQQAEKQRRMESISSQEGGDEEDEDFDLSEIFEDDEDEEQLVLKQSQSKRRKLIRRHNPHLTKEVVLRKSQSVAILRWIGLLPCAVIAAWLAWMLIVFINNITLRMTGIDPDSFLSRLFVELVSNAAMGAVFVYTGAKVAPVYHKIVAYVLVGVGLVLAGFLLFPAFMVSNYWAVWGGVCFAGGVGFMAYSVSTGEVEL